MVIGATHHPLLVALAKGNPKLQRQILNTCDDSCIRLIAQIAGNLITGHISLTPRQISHLKKHHRHILRELRHRGTPIREKRRLLIKHQKGGFLPFILPIVSTVLGGLLGRVLG